VSSDGDSHGRLIAPVRVAERSAYSGGAAPWLLKSHPLQTKMKIGGESRMIPGLNHWK
jgi:hypothetical protein